MWIYYFTQPWPFAFQEVGYLTHEGTFQQAAIGDIFGILPQLLQHNILMQSKKHWKAAENNVATKCIASLYKQNLENKQLL